MLKRGYFKSKRRMKESVVIVKEAEKEREFSPTKSDISIYRAQNELERQLGSLMSVVGNIRTDGGTPSVESIVTQLSDMSSVQRAPVLSALQQTHGNRYVQRVVAGIQAKLAVGQPGDMYEQEADRVADEVMRMPEPGVQRQADPEEEEEEILQTKPLVNQITPLVQRQVEEEEEEEMLQAKSREDATSEVSYGLESQINAIKGGGRPLAESERAFFEPRFGYDFGHVRVHADKQAAESARAVNARAYTVGRDVAFESGQYTPGTSEGKRLIAHELTHVVQQSANEMSHASNSALSGTVDTTGLRGAPLSKVNPGILQRRFERRFMAPSGRQHINELAENDVTYNQLTLEARSDQEDIIDRILIASDQVIRIREHSHL